MEIIVSETDTKKANSTDNAENADEKEIAEKIFSTKRDKWRKGMQKRTGLHDVVRNITKDRANSHAIQITHVRCRREKDKMVEYETEEE